MKTSLNEIRLIEQYLDNQLTTPDKLLFEARVLTNPTLRLNVWLQMKLLQLVGSYHREKIRNKAGDHHERFFRNPQNAQYRKRIMTLFNTREL